jgi:hypothetical protein
LEKIEVTAIEVSCDELLNYNSQLSNNGQFIIYCYAKRWHVYNTWRCYAHVYSVFMHFCLWVNSRRNYKVSDIGEPTPLVVS